MALIADSVFGIPFWELSTTTAWIGTLAYAVQIYFDFSGYSDMAIGLGKMLGFDFKENFDEPYRALSMSEFWTRWHISLSSWLRDYLYIPLGGNRRGERRAELNTMIVFVVCGIWHGAAWTFVGVGAYHGVLVTLERRAQPLLSRVPPLVRGGVTLLLVILGWVPFRARSMRHAWDVLTALFGASRQVTEPPQLPAEVTPRLGLVVLAGALAWILVRLVQASRRGDGATRGPIRAWVPSTPVSLALLTLSMIHMANTKYQPLIYFKF